MDQLKNESLLRLLKDSMKKGVLLNNYVDYELTAQDVVNFVKGIDMKMLLMNAPQLDLDRTHESLEKADIDYTKRSNTLKCRKQFDGTLKYDFFVEMSDEEYDKLCDVYSGKEE